MLLALVLLICWPIAELYVAIRVGEAIGALPTVLLLVLSWPIGVWALRSQGRAAWARFRKAVADGRTPGREVLDGAFVLIGGALMIVPGFITDALGALMLLPPTRALIRRPLTRSAQSRAFARAARFRRHETGWRDVDSTATDIEPPQLRP